ncbi:hypothetical protein [Nocardioides sambongensis]|uniref:hypothetical protein n=1 Tax=Nocardioides sambongensis TaxID=2589074 RepID=UPI00112ABC97|nr:hypothetical protein [Nocardioides sambongensis]
MSEDRPRSGAGGRPQRVRVTGPPRSAAPLATTRVGDVHDQTPMGDLYLRSLLREQGALAARVLLLAFGLLGAVPLVFYLAPGLADHHVFGIGVTWIVLGVLVHPFVTWLGWRYVRRVERNELFFADLVSPDGPAGPRQEA